MRIRRSYLLLAAIALTGATQAFGANISAIFDPGAGFSNADKATINNALAFYNANVSSNFTLTIAFSTQAGGGATSIKFVTALAYLNYYDALLTDSSGDATDMSAIASLGGGPHVNNPVTGSSNISMTTTLAALLGLIGSNSSTSWSQCGNLTANACIDIGTDLISANNGGTDAPAMFGVAQHEIDEVLGTSSSLPNGTGTTTPTVPAAADLYRYSGAGVRTFAVNPGDTNVPCSNATSKAYLSVDGGASNLSFYNNCGNGGDYGDWDSTLNGKIQVQDAFGGNNDAASLNLASPEVTLLDAVGYHLTSTSARPEPSTVALFLAGLALVPLARKRVSRRAR
jgi:hypothetical protein